MLKTSDMRLFLKDNTSTIAPAGILLLYLAASALWSIENQGYLGFKYLGYATLTLSFVIGIAIIFRHLPRATHWLLILIALTALVSATYSISLHYTYTDFKPLEDDRLYALGRMHSPTISAYSYSFALIILIHFYFSCNSWPQRIFWMLLTIPLSYAIVLAGTRGSALALLLAVITMFLANPRWSKKKKYTGAFSIVIIFFIGLMLILQSDYSELITQRSFSFRPEIWGGVLSKFAEADWTRWVFGFGIAASEQISIQEHQFVHQFEHAHSIHLATLYYGGLLGVLLLEWLIITILIRIIRAKYHPLQTLCLSLAAFSAIVLVLDGNRILEKTNLLWLLFWFPAAMAIGLSQKFTPGILEEPASSVAQPTPN
ncbi:MAG: O-antigen ligase [Candidatus Azotimanducaceae bacterium]|jgi:O-antigen ligase